MPAMFKNTILKIGIQGLKINIDARVEPGREARRAGRAHRALL